MRMNCKPGDLARIVGLQHELAELNDRLVRIAEPKVIFGVPGWTFEEPVKFVIRSLCQTLSGLVFFPGDHAKLGELWDCNLRPIRHPGDDALDEMLRPLPTQIDETLRPKRQIENA